MAFKIAFFDIVTAQTNYTKDPESCTSIMVGKKATTDGSNIYRQSQANKAPTTYCRYGNLVLHGQ